MALLFANPNTDKKSGESWPKLPDSPAGLDCERVTELHVSCLKRQVPPAPDHATRLGSGFSLARASDLQSSDIYGKSSFKIFIQLTLKDSLAKPNHVCQLDMTP